MITALPSLRRALLRLFLTLSAVTLPAAAATINVPADKPTIQSAIDAALNGDNIVVAPGTYFENIDFKGKAIQVVPSSFIGGGIPGGVTDTIIDGSGNGPAVTFASGETDSSRLVGFTIQHGGGGSGITIQNGGNDVTAGILVSNSAPTILGNTITHNNCYGVLIENASPTISGSIISNTDGTAGRWCDYVAIGTGVLVDGALASNATSSSPVYPTIFGDLIENNTDETEDASSSGGGGIHVLTGYTYIAFNTIRNNFSQQTGGGIAVSHFNPAFDTVYIVENLIYGNSSACGGGGIAFNQNTAFGIDAPVYFIYNNTIVDNTDTSNCADGLHPNGSQVYLWQDSNRFIFANNIIAGTSATQPAFYCETLRQYYPQYHLTLFDHNDLYNPQGAVIAGQCLDPTGDIYGNISADPLFKDRANGDYHLTKGSPAIDTGNNAAVFLLSDDLDGKPRQQDATSVGYPIVDLGGYEFHGTEDYDPTQIAVTPSAYVINVNDLVTFNVSLVSKKGVPYGEISVYQDGKFFVGTFVSLNGFVNLGSTVTVPGVHAFVVNYPGVNYPGPDGFAPATSIKLYVVANGGNPSNMALTSSLNPAPAGQSVTLTATVTAPSGTPSGSVTFSDGTTTLATQTLTGGIATYATSTLAIGTHHILASYTPDTTNFTASSATLTQTITGSQYASKIIFLSSPKTTNFGQAVTFTIQSASADTSYIPSPIVLAIDNTYLHSVLTTLTPDASGNATFTTTSLPIGVDHITATYAGDATHAAEQLSVDQDVIGTLTTTTSLTVIPTSGPYGTTISMFSQVVASSFSTASGTINVGSGTITYMDGATALTTITLAPNLIPNFNISTLAVGTHIITSVYSGDATFAPSTSAPVTVIITGDSTALSLAASPSPTASAFQTITLNAALTNLTNGINFPGTIAFLANGKSIGTAPIAANGGATLAVGLPAGTYILTASFAGSSALAAATSAPINEVVNPVATVTALFAKPNPGYQNATETLTATVNAQSGATIPSGTVNFLDGGALLASSPLDATGTATFSTSTLAVGTHTLTAVYTGAQSFIPSTSRTVTLDILPSDFTLTSDPSITIQTEHHNSLAVTLASVGNFADTVTITCNNLPQYASCNFPNSGAQGSFQLATGATTPFTIDIDTDALLNFASTSHPQTAARLRNTIAFALLLPVTLFALRRKLPGELRSRATRLFLALFALTLAATLTGCSGHYPGHTLPGTYNITLTAKGNATGLTHSATVTLIVTE